MFEKRKYFDYKLAYKMYEKCKKLLAKGGIDELDEYFEEMTERDNGYTYYYGSDYNAWVYIINENFDTDKEEETWLNGKEGLVVNGEVDMISYGSGEDTLFINNIEDIEKRINGLLDYAKANNYTIEDYEKELASLEWVLGILNTQEVYKKAVEDYTELQKILSKYIIEKKLETNKFEELCNLIRTDNRFSITNDLMEENMVDFWFKDILLTIKKVGNVGYELCGIEVYDTNGDFYRDFSNIESLIKTLEEDYDYVGKNNMENVLDKVIEIEDYDGNTIFSFMIDEKGNITKYNDCSVADITDDYIFDTDKLLMRIQKEEE